jgi:signal transduction histidine kinase/DNA-binding response OmpR family regulator
MIAMSASPLLVNNVFNNDISAQNCSEILDLQGSEVFTIDNEIQDNWTGKQVLELFGRYYLRSENNFFKMAGTVREGSFGAVHIPPPWRSWWAFTVYGLVIVFFLLWYRRFLLNRAALKTALEIERIEREKVQEMDQMKSRFFANISHEFRTPVTLLLGPLNDMMKNRPELADKDRATFKMMQRNAGRLLRLVNQLLDLSKLETGNIKLQVSEGNLTEFISRIVLSFLSLAESKEIRYEYDLPDITEPVYYDGDKLEKILTNLISNAFKFTPERGRISIILKYLTPEGYELPQQIEISVSDTGKGIPRDQIDKIFDRFYQVSSSEAEDEEGSGIGLSLTRELVGLYRGEIRVESKPGKGSVFTVNLPVAREQFTENELVTIQPDQPDRMDAWAEEFMIPEPVEYDLVEGREEGLNGPIILVVEDNLDLRKYIAGNLDPAYRIIEAGNGRAGMDKAFESIPDLVISDLMMPEMDGIEMCNRLRSDERTCHIPVVMLTAKADRESKLDGLKTGADDYITKPFDADELRVRVDNLIEQRRRLRQKYRKEFLTGQKDIQLAPPDEAFLERVSETIQDHLTEVEFNIESLSHEIGLSRSQLYRKIVALTGFSPVEYQRNIRLKHAARMFQEKHRNIAQVAYQVGFSNPSYFSESFRELYGSTPSEYIKKI